MSRSTINGKWAVVTGASSGLGVDFAVELASRGVNLVLVARRREPMVQLAGELEAHHDVAVDVVSLNLARAGAPQELYQRVSQTGREVAVLVNNAGFGIHGNFLDETAQRQQQLIDVNIRSLVELTHLFATDMVGRGFGRLLQVGSLLGFHAAPGFGTYSASKAFTLAMSEAINHELRARGVSSTVLTPGITRTAFYRTAGVKPNRFQRAVMMDSRQVARIGIGAMLKGKPIVVPGVANKMLVSSYRILPRRLVTRILAVAMAAESIEPRAQGFGENRRGKSTRVGARVDSRVVPPETALD